MQKKLRIVGYARESTKDQARYGFNLDDQEKKIRKYVDVYYEEDTYVFEMVREEGASAKSLDRPKMKEVLKQMCSGKIDVLIIHNLDRLTRRVKDLAELLEMFDENDVRLISITEKIDTKTAMGRFFIYLIVLIAQWEQETISSRTVRGITESAQQGNYASPSHPFGYRRNPEDTHKLIIHDDEAEIVKEIFNKIAYEEYSPLMMVHMLNKRKACGRQWSETLVQKILSNKIYYGTYERFGVEYPDHTPQIIDKELFDLAQNRMYSRRNPKLRKYLYKGMVKCKSCGKIMKCHSCTTVAGKIHLYYQCSRCKGIQVAENRINEEYEKVFAKNVEGFREMTHSDKRNYLLKKVKYIDFDYSSGTLNITYIDE